MTKHYNFIGIGCVVVASMGFAFKAVFVKMLIAHGLSVPTIIVWRYAIAAPFFLAFVAWRYGLGQLFSVPTRTIATICTAGFFGYYLASFSDFKALEIMPAGLSRFVTFTFPAVILIWHTVEKRKFPPKEHIIAFFTMQLGMYFLLLAGGATIGSQSAWGLFWCAGVVIFYSAYIIIAHRIMKDIPSAIFTTYVVLTALVCTIIHYIMTPQTPTDSSLIFSGEVILLFCLHSFFSTFVPIILMAEGIKRIGGSRSALISMFNPFFVVCIAYIFLGEGMTFYQWVGGIILFISIAILEGKLPIHKLFRRQI